MIYPIINIIISTLKKIYESNTQKLIWKLKLRMQLFQYENDE